MPELNKIPVYSLTIDMLEEDCGVSVMSLVKDPAVKKTFLALSEDKKKEFKLSIDNERHIITGVALRADYPIARIDDTTGEEYFFTVSPPEMEKIIEKYMSDPFTRTVTVEHDDRQYVDGLVLFESFIFTEKHKDVYPEFSDIEPGSWFVSYKVNNPEVWDLVKQEKIRGFSVELTGYLHKEQPIDNNEINDLLLLYLNLENE